MSKQDQKAEAISDRIAQKHFDVNSPDQCHSHHVLSREIRRAVSAGKADSLAEAVNVLHNDELADPQRTKEFMAGYEYAEKKVAALQTKQVKP